MIGAQNAAADLRVAPVIGPEWVWPTDPRDAQMRAAAVLALATVWANDIAKPFC